MTRLAPRYQILLCAAALQALPALGFSAPSTPAPAPKPKPPGPVGNADRGRGIFNGIGGCYGCHGFDAFIARRPTPTPKIKEELARMNPKPADLRNPASLKSRSETDRVLTIRKGHQGTAMFPKTFLTDREIADLLEYLAALRQEAGPPRSRR